MKFKLAQKVLCFLCAVSVMTSVAQPAIAAMQAEGDSTQANNTVPEATETPEATPVPESTQTPEISPTPKPSENPEATATPDSGENSEGTQTPETEEKPQATESPESGEIPKEEEPQPSEQPQPTATPEATDAPIENKPEDGVAVTLGENTKTWFVLTNNGAGGHNYGTNGPVTALYQGAPAKEENKLSMEFMPTTENHNFGIFYYYLDDNNWLYVGSDPTSGWYYQYKVNGNGSYPKISGLPTPKKGEPMNISISLGRETMVVNVNGVEKKVTNQDFFALSEKVNAAQDRAKFGVMTKGSTSVEFSNVMLGNEKLTENWSLLRESNGTLTTRQATLVNATGRILDSANNNQPMAGATVRAGMASTVTNENGEFTLSGLETGEYTLAVTKPGYEAVSKTFQVQDTDVALGDITLDLKADVDLSKYDYIQSDSMRVYLGKTFPVVAQYQLNYNSENPQIFRGQIQDINQFSINGVEIVPEVTSVTQENGVSSKSYNLVLKNTEANIDLAMTVQISVQGQDLTWQITQITKNQGCAPIDTIEVPNLNLLTVTDLDAEKAAEQNKPHVGFAGAKASTVTTESGDVYIGFGENGGFIPSESDGYLYGFLTNGTLSAGLWSNSEIEGDKRVQRNNGADSISLTSSLWYYERGDKNAQRYATNKPGTTYPTSDLPCVKVALSSDSNQDNVIDWNDGAVAFRRIVNVPMGSEKIKDLVNYRIVMNFASMAPNPFLESADNIKKVFLATDGLPQAVMLKGYGNEGHDSANSEYADIAVREGGVEDFQDLIKIAHEYDTEIGIHVNAQEAYPESNSFSNEMIGYPNVGNGWGWLDQSHVIDKLWDLSTQNRWKRFVQLYDRINNTNFLTAKWPAIAGSGTVNATMEQIAQDAMNRPDNMDFIYLDVWYQDAWETRRVAEEINSLGWRFTTEFSAQGEYDSTWQHWSTDAVYGGASMKGYNSDIIRFIRNDQRDSQVLNYPEFGGTADNPLLGGFRLAGFEGWDRKDTFPYYINRTFSENLPTRFLQHYQVVDWENYSGVGDDVSPVGNHEKQITLKDDKNNTVVVTRNEKQRQDDIIERTITLNGKVVLNDATYLLPWEDNQDGSLKLYHWNHDGGKTTWDLPAEMASLPAVVMYQLSDQGRINPKTIYVKNGQVELDAVAQTAYVLVAEPGVKTLKSDYGQADYAVDPGFNGYADGESLDKADWQGDISAESVKVRVPQDGDQELVFGQSGKDVAVSTKLRGLKAGQTYVAEIYVNNASDSKASVSVNTGSKTETNYTYRSIASNYVKCDEERGTNSQWIQVYFTAESDTATFTLAREAGAGEVMWDDIRVVPITLNNQQADGSFQQDFESVVQGLYPFVLGPAQGITDPVTHLSQLNAPYTQSGWHTKTLDDVISGEWSLKHHGSNNGIIYQTIPQNFRFEPGKVYEVSFDYQSGPSGAYAMVVGDGANYTRPANTEEYFQSTKAPAVGQKSTTKKHTMQVVGSASGQTWIGLYSNGQAGDDAMGGKDFILDNLVIREVAEQDAGVTLTVDKNNLFLGEVANVAGSNLESANFENTNPEVAEYDPQTKTIRTLSAGTTTITANKGKAATSASVTITVRDKESYDMRSEDTKIVAEVNGQPGVGSAAILDKNPSTNWDGKWDSVTKENPAKAVIDLGKEMPLSGFRFMQRNQYNKNGMIQGYRYTVGTKIDENGTITDGQASEWVTVEDPRENTWVDQRLDKARANPTVRYIQIEVYGSNNNATMAEFVPYLDKMVATTATVKDTTVSVGQSIALEAIAPENTLLKGLVWNSDNKEILAVTADGVATGVKEGTATVTVTNTAGLKASATITVQPAPAKPLPDSKALADELSVSYTIDLDKYKDGPAKDAFVKALAKAKEIQANLANYTQNQVDTAVVELTAARLKLQEKDPVPPVQLPDTKALVEEINLSNAVDLAKYKDGAEKTNFINALTRAKEIVNNLANYTQQHVDAATGELRAARLGLKPVDPTVPPAPTTPPTNGGQTSTNNPATGDSFEAMPWAIAFVLSSGAVVAGIYLKKNKNKM